MLSIHEQQQQISCQRRRCCRWLGLAVAIVYSGLVCKLCGFMFLIYGFAPTFRHEIKTRNLKNGTDRKNSDSNSVGYAKIKKKIKNAKDKHPWVNKCLFRNMYAFWCFSHGSALFLCWSPHDTCCIATGIVAHVVTPAEAKLN